MDIPIDDHGVRWPNGRYTPWSEIDSFVQVDDEHEHTHVHVVLRDGTSLRIPGLATNFAGLTRERAAQIEALNRLAATRRTPSQLVFPVRLRTTRAHWWASGLTAFVLLTLSAGCVAVVATSRELAEAPLVGLILMVVAGLCTYVAGHLLHWGWRTATITPDEVVVRSPFTRREIPLARVAAFLYDARRAGRRTCHLLHHRAEPGSGLVELPLPGHDPEYRLPALNAHVHGQSPSPDDRSAF